MIDLKIAAYVSLMILLETLSPVCNTRIYSSYFDPWLTLMLEEVRKRSKLLEGGN